MAIIIAPRSPATRSDLAVANAQGHSAQGVRLAEATDPTDAYEEWQQNLGARIMLQADLTWSGAQDGYVAAGWGDSANPYSSLWWNLEPIAQHCSDCPVFAAGSPYDPPWVDGGNILNATPGDGNTECGAACKCDLSYGGSLGYTRTQDWKAWLPQNMPDAPDGPMEPVQPPAGKQPPAAPPEPPEQPSRVPPSPFELPEGVRRSPYGPIIPGGEFTDGQKAALDLYRLAELEWNAVRGQLPELPNFFTLANPNFSWPRLKWEELTKAQQKALSLALEAWFRWSATLPEGWQDYYDEDPYAFGDGDSDTYKLFNPNHDSRGRFAVGSGGGLHVSGGGVHGAAQHAGGGHIGAHLGAHFAAGSGGGGGGTAGAKAKPAATKATKAAKPKAPPKQKTATAAKTTKTTKTTKTAAKSASKKTATVKKAEPEKPKTNEELAKEARSRLNKAQREMTAANKHVAEAEARATELQRTNAHEIQRLVAAHAEARASVEGSFSHAREALLEERAAARAASGKAPKAAERMAAARAPYHEARAAFEAAQAKSAGSHRVYHDLLTKYAPQYRNANGSITYNAVTRMRREHPDLKAAEKQHYADERAAGKASSLMYRRQSAYERPRDQLAQASKVTPEMIDAHPMRARLVAEEKSAREQLDRASGADEVFEAHQARDAAQHELTMARFAVAHPTYKYALSDVETHPAHYTKPEDWPEAKLHEAEKADETMKARIAAGEVDKHVGDLALGALQHEQGFDGRASIVDEKTLEAGIKAGDHEIWRGDTTLGHTEEFMTGAYHPGLGIRGNGTYVQEHASRGLTTAKSYASGRRADGTIAKGTIMRMALKADAKIVDYNALRAEQRKAMDEARKLLDAETRNANQTGIRRAKLLQWIAGGDSSRFAVARGYDAIRIPAHGQMIILNRTAVRISHQVRPHDAQA